MQLNIPIWYNISLFKVSLHSETNQQVLGGDTRCPWVIHETPLQGIRTGDRKQRMKLNTTNTNKLYVRVIFIKPKVKTPRGWQFRPQCFCLFVQQLKQCSCFEMLVKISLHRTKVDWAEVFSWQTGGRADNRVWHFGFETSQFRSFSNFLDGIGFHIKNWHRKKYQILYWKYLVSKKSRIRYRIYLVTEKVSDSVLFRCFQKQLSKNLGFVCFKHDLVKFCIGIGIGFETFSNFFNGINSVSKKIGIEIRGPPRT